MSLTQETFTTLEQEINTKWPTAKYLASDRDIVSVFDFSNRLVRSNPISGTNGRREEFRKELMLEVQPLLGEEIAQSVYEQLKTNHSISTAQHFTPISSPFTLNPTLQRSLAYYQRNEIDRKNIIVLACAGISFANHYIPRSYFFHTASENEVFELQLPFFGRAIDPYPVISKSAYTNESRDQIEKRLRRYQSEKQIKKNEFEKIQQLLQTIFSDEILKQTTFIDQITIQNYHIWRTIFSHHASEMPNLVFLSQERVAAKLLKNYHLYPDSILNKMMFNSDYHKLMLEYFNNITCAFSIERKYGTFLFWGMKKDTTQRLQLFPKNGKLVSFDESIAIDITPEAIGQALENGDLVPGVLLTFLVISFYYGLFISGGLLQPWYLSEAKSAYIKMLTQLGEEDELAYCQGVFTNDSVVTRPSIAFLQGPQNQRIPATGLDMILYGNEQSWPSIIESLKHTMYNELMYRAYPDIYKSYVQDENKSEELLAITEQEVEQFTGIDKKIPAWGVLD
jgi:hypothetical protein